MDTIFTMEDWYGLLNQDTTKQTYFPAVNAVPLDANLHI